MAQRPKIAAVPVGTSRTEVIALVMSVVWMVMVSAFFLIMPTTPQGEGFDSLRFILTLIAVFLPVAMIWVAALSARSTQIMRAETKMLHNAIDALRSGGMPEHQGNPLTSEASVERKLNQIAQATKKPDVPVPTFTTSRENSLDLTSVKKSAPEQPALAFEAQPLSLIHI